jgi:YD repeat-containing protein
MRVCLVMALLAIGCSDRKPAKVSRAEVAPIRDAATPIVDAPANPWMDALLARGGPGQCATIRDGSLVIARRDPSGRVLETMAFDAKHRTDPAERVELTYNAAGQLTRQIVRGSESHDYDRTTDFWYTDGRVVRVRTRHDHGSPDLNVTYRWQGKRVAAIADTLRLPALEDPLVPTAYVLPFTGTVHEARFHDGSPAPQPENEYDYTYDARGRLVHTHSVGWAGPSKDAVYTWDDSDHLLSMHDPASSITTTTRYDWRDGRLVAIHYVDHTDKELYRTEIHRDGDGRVIEELRFDAEPSWQTVSSHVEGDTVVINSVQLEAGTPRSRTQYRYDCAGR